MLKNIKEKNPSLQIFDISDPSFLKYGKVIQEYDFSSWVEIMKSRDIPDSGNIYIANDSELSKSAVFESVQKNLYGNMPIQSGYCNGNGSNLNALEYHKSSELNVAITDLVLLLGNVYDIVSNEFLSSNVKGYFLPAGTACEIYATTLHFAPCKVNDDGFKCIVVLPKGTNEPLEEKATGNSDEENLLWMQNKWLIAHPESIPASKGAFVGIKGNNIKVSY